MASAASAQTQAFEAASVRLHPSADRARPNVAAVPASGRLTIMATTVQNVILAAYGLHPAELVANDSPILKQPVDIVATAGRPATTTEMQRMLQPLLTERFKLAVHRENREVDAYVVTRPRTDRLGPKLIRSSADCGRLGDTNTFAREEVAPGAPGQARCGIGPGGIGRIIVNGMDMKGILGFVFTSPQRAIVDQTGLEGRYDIDVTFTPESFSVASLAQRRYRTGWRRSGWPSALHRTAGSTRPEGRRAPDHRARRRDRSHRATPSRLARPGRRTSDAFPASLLMRTRVRATPR